MKDYSGKLGDIARYWFEVLRNCGDDVLEILHDGHPTAGLIFFPTTHILIARFTGSI